MHTSSSAIDFQTGFSDAWSSIATFVPKLAGFLVIMLIGWIIAKMVAAIVVRALDRVGFDRLVEHGGLEQMLARSSYGASDLLAKLGYYAILLIALQLGFGVFGPNPVSAMLNGIISWLPKAAVAIVIVVIVGALAHAVRDMVANMLGGLSYGAIIGRIAAVFIWGVGIVAALDQIGVATSVTMPILITVLATIGGILVVGVGGGLIRPMRRRWEGWMSDLESEMPAVRGHGQPCHRGREDAVREQIWMDQQAARGQGWADAIQDDYSHQGGFSHTGEYMRYDDPRDLR
ncbi:mechanosensitive ion channel family protein [Nocardia pseudovaccinii]|uniref:mechanosensitive ion channel family protein n=1 Tax=Nocardia pseudovaccinii TaxID=189540 RepID=UPI003D913865